MKYSLAFDDFAFVKDKVPANPLIRDIRGIISRVANFKERAREYYFEVILSPYQCPECGEHLYMTGQSECSCSCGNTFDPTLAFQRSSCCRARLVRKTFHYACSRCNNIVPSKFLFDEKLFDKAYFKEMMQESRRRIKEKREEMKMLLAESRSGALPLMENPHLESIPGLIQDLNDFIQGDSDEVCQLSFDSESGFHMNYYRNHILSTLSWNSILFSDIAPLIGDCRQDKVWRFIALVFMQNEHEVDLTQHGTDLWVQRVYNETYKQG